MRAEPWTTCCATTLLLVLLATGAIALPGMSLGFGVSPSGGIPEDVSEAMFAGLRYSMVGPSRGGRVTAVAGHRALPSTFFLGASGGGVWRTTDYGQNWWPVSDGYFATGSIGAIRLSDSDPNVVYVGTGSDGLRSNVIIGKGMYKSVDGGDSWTHIGLEDVGNIGAVLIHPDKSNLVYVAAIGNPFLRTSERGVYRSRDGGESWEKVLFVSDGTGAVDLEFAPDDSARIYATLWRAERKPWTIISGGMEGGVYRSTDSGDNWVQLTEGLPGGLRGKGDLAVSGGDPDRVYVLIEAPGDEGGVYRSDDRGDSWRQVTDFQPIRNRPFYYTNLEAHPLYPDTLWGMAEGYFKSTDGGMTWQQQQVPHGDNHDLWINPDRPEVMVQANDGGANVTLNGGRTWSTQHNQPTAELYQVNISDDFPYRLYAGQQDNSTISVPSLPTRRPGGHTAEWEAHGGCETGPAVPRPGDPNIVYANCKGRFGLYDRRTGQEKQYYVGFWNIYGRNPKDLKYRFQRVAPIHVSPHDPDRVYHTSQFVHVTEDGGRTWAAISPDLTAFPSETQVVSGGPITIDVTGEEHFSVIYDIQESPHEPGVIWVGSNDGPVHITRDGGLTWADVTPPELGPYGRVQNIEVSPHEPARAYVTVLRYQVGDFRPHAYRTRDYGASWTLIADGIPDDNPVRVIREDPDRAGLLYAGTEFGMYISFDDGASWLPFQLNLPMTPVSDIKVVNQDLVLSTMGRSFWILYDLTPLHEMSSLMASASAHLFRVKDPYLLRGGRPRNFGQPPPDSPDYPSPGVNIDYWLAEETAVELRLQILDARGDVVREFSSEASGERTVLPAVAGMREWRLEKAGTPRLPASAGLHRFVWDLRLAGPWAERDNSGRGGPMAAPGWYQAKLILGDHSQVVSFAAIMDPRTEASGVSAYDVAAQLELSSAVRDTLSRARLTAVQLRQAREQVNEGGTKAARLARLDAQLNTDGVRYSPPMLLDQLQYLYQNLNTADQRPGRDAYERFEDLRSELDGLERRLDQVLGGSPDN